MNNTEPDITNINYLNNIDKEIVIALIGGVGTICTAFLGFLGVWSSRNFECGCSRRMTTHTDESDDEEGPSPEVHTPVPVSVPVSSPGVVSSPPSQLVQTPTPPMFCGPCQILETPLDSFLGIIKVNRSNCYSRRVKCQFCGKHFCTYHLSPNNDGATGGHICKKYIP